MKKIVFFIFIMQNLFANVEPVSIDQVVLNQLSETTMSYYVLEASKGETITARLDELSADGDIYIKVGSMPTLLTYDNRSINTDQREDSVSVTLNKDSSVYIAVYAFKDIDYRLKVSSSQALDQGYGSKGVYAVEMTPIGNSSSIVYHPSNWQSEPTPVIFFLAGFMSRSHEEYRTLLHFIASKGYSVIYVPDNADITESDIALRLHKYEKIVKAFSSHLKPEKMGIIGFSAGGGIAFSLLNNMLKNHPNWGVKGRFLMLLEPWFAFAMDKSSMLNIVHTNVLFLQFGKRGSDSDPRIALSEYKLLRGVAPAQKDYQVYEEPNIDHYYPRGSRDSSLMQGLLKPLDALMEYTFKKKEVAYDVALNRGSDKPYENGEVILKAIENYAEGGCKGEHPKQKAMLLKYDIDYCGI